MWWLPAGQVPTVEEGKAKLEYLKLHADSSECFTFAKPYLPPRATRRHILTAADRIGLLGEKTVIRD